MKRLQQLGTRARIAARVLRAALPGPARSHRPVRLVLALPAAGWTEEDVRELVVDLRRWVGPVRVVLRPGPEAGAGQVVRHVRFAQRLDMPVHLLGGEGAALEDPAALLDAGLAAATLASPDAVAALDEARRARAWPLLLLGLLRPASPDLPARAAALRQAGADRLVPSIGPGEPPVDLAALERAAGPALRVPEPVRGVLEGRPRRLPLPLRLALDASGDLRPADGVPPIPRPEGPGGIRAAWEGAGRAIEAARRMPLPHDVAEMVPRVLHSPGREVPPPLP